MNKITCFDNNNESIMSIVRLNTIYDKFNPHFLNCVKERNGDLPLKIKVRTIPAKDLLFHPLRFDLMIKYLYIKYNDMNTGCKFANELYSKSIQKSDGSFFEEDRQKNSLDDYLTSFHKTIVSIKNNNFDKKISVIPVNKDNVILDGAHRLSISAYLNKHVTIAEFDYPAHYLDHNYYAQQKKMTCEQLDFVAYNYCLLNHNCYIVNLRFPDRTPQVAKVIEILNNYGRVYYNKTINFTLNGAVLREYTFYKNEKWIGSPDDGFSGAKRRVEALGFNEIQAIIFECYDLEEVVNAKNALRDIYKSGNDPVHITDTREEMLDLAQLYFNKNTLHLFNTEHKYPNNSLIHSIKTFKQWLTNNKINYEDIVVDGSTIMGLYGIRETQDIDYLLSSQVTTEPKSSLYDDHSTELKYHLYTKNEMIYNPTLHLYFDGIKFITLDTLKRMKKQRSEYPKDFNDIRLIGSLMNNNRKADLMQVQFILKSVIEQSKNIFWKVIPIVFPEGTFRRECVKKINYFRKKISFVLSNPKLFLLRMSRQTEQSIKYYKYRLHFSKRTSIVERYLIEGRYEHDVINAIFSILDSANISAKALDIGANIGMITLAMANRYDNLSIFAFEPGPHQFAYLKKNIESNNLSHRVIAKKIALSNKTGEAPFAIHTSKDASGDGLLDTMRAGSIQTITIKTDTLDNWWKKNGKPLVTFVKIDVEGAELLILQGGLEFIKNNKPIILFELHPKNIEPYPYSVSDVFNFFRSNNYEVINTNFSALGGNQKSQLLLGNYAGEFIARSK